MTNVFLFTKVFIRVIVCNNLKKGEVIADNDPDEDLRM